MKLLYCICAMLVGSLHAQETMPWASAALLNQIETREGKNIQSNPIGGFLLKYQNDTFAVTSIHILSLLPQPVKKLSIDGTVRRWSMFSPAQPQQRVVTHQLINTGEYPATVDVLRGDKDFLIFSLAENHSTAKPLEPRLSPMDPGEKIFAVACTDPMKDAQVFTLEYVKNNGRQLLFQNSGSVSGLEKCFGAPLVDARGLLVGMFSGVKEDPVSHKKYVASGLLEHLLDALKTDKKE